MSKLGATAERRYPSRILLRAIGSVNQEARTHREGASFLVLTPPEATDLEAMAAQQRRHNDRNLAEGLHLLILLETI